MKRKKHMTHPLYLTAQERKAFEKLPAKLREGWIVTEEMLTSYETEKQLKIRREIFRKKDPAFVDLLKKLEGMKESKTMEETLQAIGPITKPLLLHIYFTMGAGFLRECIAGMLPLSATDSDLQGMAEFSALRHLLLESNAQPVS